MAQQLGIRGESVREIELDPNSRDILPYLVKNAAELNQSPGETIMIRTKGFEGLQALKSPAITYRVAHDFDQDICEPNNALSALRKKVVVISQINASSRDTPHNIDLGAIHDKNLISFSPGLTTVYELAVYSAAASQFKRFLFET